MNDVEVYCDTEWPRPRYHMCNGVSILSYLGSQPDHRFDRDHEQSDVDIEDEEEECYQ